MAIILKDVGVKRTVYSFNRSVSFVNQYIDKCVRSGSNSNMYKNPAIATVFYDEGTNAAADIDKAVSDYHQSPTKGNRKAIKNKVFLGKIWLGKYADKVVAIANSNSNRSTRNEAANNIYFSYLTPQKLANTKKGIPPTPRFVVHERGAGNFDVNILNGAGYDPTFTVFVAVERSSNAIVTLINGHLSIEMQTIGQIVMRTVGKKGRNTSLNGLKRGTQFMIYAYAQHGSKQVSMLSPAMMVRS